MYKQGHLLMPLTMRLQLMFLSASLCLITLLYLLFELLETGNSKIISLDMPFVIQKPEADGYNTLNSETCNVIRVCNQDERKLHMETMCKEMKSTSHKIKTTFLVDNEHKIAYCFIPKVASSTWKMIMMVSTKEGKSMKRPFGAHRIRELTSRGLRLMSVNSKIANYTKFMITRNPIDRLVSAYFDKLARNVSKDDVHYEYYRSIRNSVLKYNKRRFNEEMPSVQFEDFIKFVLYSKKSQKHREDQHWRKYVERCQPCTIK